MRMLSHTEAQPAEVFYYQAFGLTIASTVPCPELLPQAGAPDITVQYGAVPEALDEVQDATGWYQQNSQAVLLKVNSIARYLILRGEKIIIEPATGSRADEVRLFLFGSAFGALLHQRGMLPLHGSAIEVHGGAVMFVGPAGHGKSTLAGAFHLRGYRLIADDVCVVSTDKSGRPTVYPGFPRLKLWADTLENLGKNPQELRRVIPKIDKRHLPLTNGFCPHPRPLQRIYELAIADTQEFELMPLQGQEKFWPLIEHTYRLQFLTGSDRKKLHFRQCAATARQVAVRRVTRPRRPFRLGDLMALVEQDWEREDAP